MEQIVKMTRQELKDRCIALAGVGDVQAATTLELLGEIGRLEELSKRAPPIPVVMMEEIKKANTENEGLRKRVADLTYVLLKIKITMTMADTILSGAVKTRDAVPTHEQQVMKESAERGRQRLVLLREAQEAGFEAEVADDLKKNPVATVATDPDAAALAETRRRLGLPPTQDPAVTEVIAKGPAGAWDKTQKINKDGNKDN